MSLLLKAATEFLPHTQQEPQIICNLYMGQRVKLHLNQEETDSVEIGRGVRQGSWMLPILFNLYSEYLMNKALDEGGYFKIGRRINNKVVFADDMVM